MKSLVHTVCLLSLSLPLAAHALTDDEPLPMRYEAPIQPGGQSSTPGAGPASTSRLVDGCALYVTQVEDLRRYPEYVGNVSFAMPGPLSTPLFMQSIRGAGGREWAMEALKTLTAQGFQPRIGETPTTPASAQAVAAVELKLAHTWSAGLNLLSHVVLRVRYQNGGTEDIRHYHGLGSKLNWANGNGEFMTTLNHAMTEAVAAFAVDAASVCAGRQLASQKAGG
jgi:hypothetical protein